MTSLPGAVPTASTTCVGQVRMRITPAPVSTSKRWFALPLHGQIVMLAPSSNEPLLSRQKRGSWRLRIRPVVGSWLHFCQFAPEQVHCATFVPGAIAAFQTSRHRPEARFTMLTYDAGPGGLPERRGA